jgi:hypothetical protein
MMPSPWLPGRPGDTRRAASPGADQPRGQDRTPAPTSRTGPRVPSRQGPRPPFDTEIRDALRYEKGLAVKAVLALGVVAGVLLAHIYLFT